MESGKDPRWMPWLKAQGEHTRAVFGRLPGRAALLRDISARSGALASIGTVRSANGSMVYREQAAGGEDFRLMIRAVHKEPRLLLDPATAIPGEPMVIDSYALSSDGKTVAVSMSKRGTERSVLHFVDAASGRIAPERVNDVAAVRWLPGAEGITYLKFVGEHGTPSYYIRSQARLRILASAEDRAIPTRGLPHVAAIPARPLSTARNMQRSWPPAAAVASPYCCASTSTRATGWGRAAARSMRSGPICSASCFGREEPRVSRPRADGWTGGAPRGQARRPPG